MCYKKSNIEALKHNTERTKMKRPIDRTIEIFNEIYSGEFIAELVSEYQTKHPHLKADPQDPDKISRLAILDEKMRRYSTQDADILAGHLIAQSDDNRAKGWSNE